MLRKAVQRLPTRHSVWNDGVHAALARTPYALHVCGPHLQSSCGPRLQSVLVCICMLVVFAAVRVCMCVCVFAAAPPQYKRGHRKTASFGTILDVPKIVVTGITGPLGFLVTGWSWLG